MSTLRLYTQGVLAAMTLMALFIFCCLVGSLSAYLAIIPILLSLLLLDWRALLAAAGNRGSWLFIAAFGLLAIAFYSTAREFKDYLSPLDFSGFLLFIATLALFSRLATPRAGGIVVNTALFGVAAAVSYGLFQTMVLGIERADGGFISIFYSNLGVLLGFVALGGALLPGNRWRWVYAAGPVLGILCGMLGQTRASIVAALVMALIFAVFAIRHWPRRFVLAGLGVAAAAGVAIVLFASSRAFSAWEALMQLLVSQRADESVNIRLDLYQAGLKAFSESPLVGHGWYHRFSAAQPHMTNPDILGYFPTVSHLHNDALNFAVGAGIPGVAAYLLALAAPIVAVWQTPRDSQRDFRLYAILILVAGFLITGTPDSMFVFELTKTVYCLAAGVFVGFCRDVPFPQFGKLVGGA